MARPKYLGALTEVGKLQGLIRERKPNLLRPEEVEPTLALVEEALNEAAELMWEARGELAARDGHEIILTFDRIGTEGVPTNHAEGTLLKCTDSERSWRLTGGEWVAQ